MPLKDALYLLCLRFFLSAKSLILSNFTFVVSFFMLFFDPVLFKAKNPYPCSSVPCIVSTSLFL